MKKYLLLSLLALTACATTQTPLDTQKQFVQACSAYNAAFVAVLQLREAGKLNTAQIAAISVIDTDISPLCTGALPTDAATATQRITIATTSLTVAYITKQGVKK